MTEKKHRFTIEPTIMRECIVDNFTGEQLDTFDYTERLCEVLNALHEENERLKTQLQRCEIDFKQFEKECQECEKGILQIIDDKIQSARELGTVKTVIVLKNLRKEVIKCKD